MKLNVNQWQNSLAKLIAEALVEFRGTTDDEMEMFAVDCHPWNGVIVLAFLTHSELKDAPFLSEAAEMAAWKYYGFGASLASWQPASDLAAAMRSAYENAGEDRQDVANQFFQGCAAAVASKPVQDALSAFRLAQGFKVSIPHPDSGAEYYRPKLSSFIKNEKMEKMVSVHFYALQSVKMN